MTLSEAFRLYIQQQVILKGGADKTRRNYETACNSLLAAVGDIPVTPHVFRHSTITDYLAKGAPMSHVKDIAGHASIKTTIDIYGHIQPEVIKETILTYRK